MRRSSWFRMRMRGTVTFTSSSTWRSRIRTHSWRGSRLAPKLWLTSQISRDDDEQAYAVTSIEHSKKWEELLNLGI